MTHAADSSRGTLFCSFPDCPRREKRFCSAQVLKRHVALVHKAERREFCPFTALGSGCSIQTHPQYSRTRYIDHILETHMRYKYPCFDCGQAFSSRSLAYRHRSTGHRCSPSQWTNAEREEQLSIKSGLYKYARETLLKKNAWNEALPAVFPEYDQFIRIKAKKEKKNRQPSPPASSQDVTTRMHHPVTKNLVTQSAIPPSPPAGDAPVNDPAPGPSSHLAPSAADMLCHPSVTATQLPDTVGPLPTHLQFVEYMRFGSLPVEPRAAPSSPESGFECRSWSSCSFSSSADLGSPDPPYFNQFPSTPMYASPTYSPTATSSDFTHNPLNREDILNPVNCENFLEADPFTPAPGLAVVADNSSFASSSPSGVEDLCFLYGLMDNIV